MNANIDLNNSPKIIHEHLCEYIKKLTNEKTESCLLDMHKVINSLPKNKLKDLKIVLDQRNQKNGIKILMNGYQQLI